MTMTSNCSIESLQKQQLTSINVKRAVFHTIL